MTNEVIKDIQCLRQQKSNVRAPTDKELLADNKSQPLIPMAPYLKNVDVHSNNENKGYKNPPKPKARRYITLIPKTIPKLNSFTIYFN